MVYMYNKYKLHINHNRIKVVDGVTRSVSFKLAPSPVTVVMRSNSFENI